jgi:protein O-GlcNAc transferase
VITLVGEPHMARVGASLLAAVGLDELVAASADDYVGVAVSLAQDHARRSALRGGMRSRMEASRLLDAVAYTRSFEALLRRAWADWCAAQAAG